MNLEIASVVLTGAGVVLGVLLGVWRIQAHYEMRNDAAHAELARKIENALSNVRGEITKVTLDLQKTGHKYRQRCALPAWPARSTRHKGVIPGATAPRSRRAWSASSASPYAAPASWAPALFVVQIQARVAANAQGNRSSGGQLQRPHIRTQTVNNDDSLVIQVRREEMSLTNPEAAALANADSRVGARNGLRFRTRSGCHGGIAPYRAGHPSDRATCSRRPAISQRLPGNRGLGRNTLHPSCNSLGPADRRSRSALRYHPRGSVRRGHAGVPHTASQGRPRSSTDASRCRRARVGDLAAEESTCTRRSTVTTAAAGPASWRPGCRGLSTVPPRGPRSPATVGHPRSSRQRDVGSAPGRTSPGEPDGRSRASNGICTGCRGTHASRAVREAVLERNREGRTA